MNFTFRLTWDAEKKKHVGLCNELPELSCVSKTADGAIRGIKRKVGGSSPSGRWDHKRWRAETVKSLIASGKAETEAEALQMIIDHGF